MLRPFFCGKKVLDVDRETVNTYHRVTILLELNEFIQCSGKINHSGSQHMAERRFDETHLREHHGFTRQVPVAETSAR